MNKKKSFLIICLILLIITIGGVSAADNTTHDTVSAVESNTVQAETTHNDGGNISDTVTVSNDKYIDKEILQAKNVDEIEDKEIVTAGKQVKNDEVLGATNDEDVLGATVYDTGVGDTWENLRTFFNSNKVNAGDTVILTHDYSTRAASAVNGIKIGNMVIIGQNSVDGGSINITKGRETDVTSGRTFYINDNSVVTIKNINFYHNKHDINDMGGAVYVGKNAVVNFINCKFIDCSQCQKGGSIYYDSGSTGNLINCTFNDGWIRHTHNNAEGGSAVYMVSANNLNITNCIFEENRATQGNGVIYVESSSTNINFNNCSFNNNYNYPASDNAKFGMGGVIYFKETVTGVNFTDCNFTNNYARNYGGAIYFGQSCSDIVFDNCNFTNNTATVDYGGALYFGPNCHDVTIINSTFDDNNAGKSGGAIYFATKVDNLLVNGSTFSNNDAKAGDGGAIYIPSGNNIDVDNSTFKQNTATNKGGAIFWGSTDSFETKDSTFEDNVAKSGATVYFDKDMHEIVVRDTKFLGNDETAGRGGAALNVPMDANVDSLYIINCTFNDNKVNGNGAAVYVPNGVKNVYVYNCSFEDNDASGNGGALWLDNRNELVISNVTFARNIANDGPNVYIATSMNTVSFNNTLFINNTARTGNGAGISLEKVKDAIINNCTFTGNKATNGNGGALYVPSTINSIKLNVTNKTYINNSAGANGGAIYWGTGIDLEINNHTFINNSAANGGAVYYNLVLNNKHFNNLTFINNTAKTTGGAIYFQEGNADLQFTNSNFTGNNATNGYGGALYFNGNSHDLTFDNLLFSNNTASSGGAIHFYSTSSQTQYNRISICNSNFTNNKATKDDEYGGSAIGLNNVFNIDFDKCIFDSNAAKANGAVMFDNFMNVTFTECNFTNNNASKNGGAIYLRGSYHKNNTAVVNCIFDNNKALTRNGGAVYTLGNNISVIGSNFTKNSAYSWGGAFIMGDESSNQLIQTSKLKIINSTFANNSAWNAGAVDAYGTSDASVINVTFENNTAHDKGGALYMTGVNGLITNSNFTNNKATNASAIAYIPPSVGAVGQTKANITNCKFTKNNATGTSTVWFESSHGRLINCNFTENTAKIAAGVYVNIDTVNITNNNFDSNVAGEDAGAIYLSAHSIKTTIENCNFTDNKAKNGGAITVNSNEITIKSNIFTGNEAENGGAIYYYNAKTDNLIEDSVFKENTANDGGAVYSQFGSTSSKSSVFINNSTFTDNTAKYNGGATYIGLNNGGKIYRDYQKFDGKAVVDSETSRWDVTDGDDEIIKNSYFENNKDYLFEVAVSATGFKSVISITLPEYADKSKIKVTITNESGVKTVHEFSSESKWVNDGNTHTLTIDNQPIGKYNVTVEFADSNLLLKDYNGSYESRDVDKGEFTKLQEMIDKAIREGKKELEINGTITFTLGYDKGQINITAPITIIGKGNTVIDALFQSRIFYINAANVTLVNIKFVNGNVSGEWKDAKDALNGGAILWNGTNGTIKNCNFTDNYAVNGGAVFIQNNGTHGKIISSAFENNVAQNNGGAVDWNATGGNVTDSSFTNNKAAYGGAVYVGSNSTKSYITKSTFTSNTATKRGGAVDWNASAGDIENSKFNQNTAEYGGAVFVGHVSDSGNIINSTFFKNTAGENGGAVDWNATGGNVKDSKFYNNTAKLGGAVYVGAEGKSGNITGSVFENNTAVRGGAVDWYAASGNIISSNFTKNTADYGGAVFIGKQSDNGNITSSRFISNKATYNGGAIDWNATNGNLTGSYFYENTAANGGAVFVGANSTSGRIINSEFIKNTAIGRGGAVDWYAASGEIVNSKFDANTAEYGGAVFVGHATDGGNITKSTFTNNIATKNGGAIDWNATHGNVSYSEFTGNNAANGGAVFVGSNSTDGAIYNSIFTDNTATGRGGAVDWYASTGNIEDSTFTNNRAANGGAVFVGTASDHGSIINSTFNNNHASEKGGAVDWNSTAGIIKSSRFNGNNATYGGAVFVGGNSTNGLIENSNFTANNATRGGAIDWNASTGDVVKSRFTDNTAVDGGAIYVGHGAQNGNITNSTFNNNKASNKGGAVYFNSIKEGDIVNTTFNDNSAEYGGAVFVDNCPDMQILNSNFTKNTANYGGAVYVNNTDGGLINNSRFTDNRALTSDSEENPLGIGAALYIEDSDRFNVTNTKFDKNSANLHAADIYVDESYDILLYNINITNSKNTESIYVNANVTIDKSEISNGIIFNTGNSTLANTTLTGQNPVMINENANVTLIKNNATANGEYSVYNNGTLTLNANNFTSVIINNGTILSKTRTVILNNQTVIIAQGEDAVLNATIVDDNNNTIICPTSFQFTVDETVIDSTGNGKIQQATLNAPARGVYTISTNSNNGLMNNEIRNATLHVKTQSKINVAVVEQINQGEKVVINATIDPTSADGKVVFIINDGERIEKDIVNGIAQLVLENLSASNYHVTAVYEGDDTHFGSQNDTSFKVELRDPQFDLHVKNILTGQNATVIITTNATGTVLLIINGKDEEVEIKNGKIEYNVTGLDAGSYTVKAIYYGDEQFKRANNQTIFTVNTMSVNVKDIELGQTALINITVPENINNGLKVYVDGTEYTDITYENGYATLNVPDLTLGAHTVNVTYNGNAYAYNEINGTVFNVTTSSNYKFDVTVTPTEYGKNTTIEVEVDGDLTGDVNVTIDGKNYTVKITDGKGSLNISNLTAGEHEIITSYPGDETHSPKEVTETVTIPQAKSDLNINITGGEPGENITVTVNVGPNATGNIVVTVDGVEHLVKVNENGTATYVIPNAQPGNHNITAEYLGDSNYAPVKSNKTVKVDKFQPTLEIDDITVTDDNNVTVNVKVTPENATGTVTVTINGENYTANVENGIAKVNIGVLPVGSDVNYNVTYSGDEKYNKTTITSSENIKVGKLNNLTVDVKVTPGQYGENTTVEVTLPADAEDGDVAVIVDGVEYPVTEKDGKLVAEIPSTVGNHTVTVKYENSTKYADKEFKYNYTVDKNDHYTLDVNITKGAYGENTTIEVTAPEGISTVNVTIDGVNYTVTINQTTGKGSMNISNLTAGKHEVVVSYPGDGNYEPKSTTEIIDIPKAVSDMNVEVTGGEPGENVTVKVTVGPNATGLVVVVINGEKHYVEVDENGTATYVIENAEPGEYNITAEFTGDDNYAKATSDKYSITVEKYEATINIGEPVIGDDNNVTVIVEIVPADATGNVTVSLANGTNITVPVKDGKAEIPVGILPVNGTMAYNVTYSGDNKYNKTTKVSDENLTVGRLNNYTVDVEIIPGQYGENTTVKVIVPAEITDGNITVKVDGVDYPVTKDDDGNYIAEIPPQTVGKHNVTITLTNSSNYADKTFNESFNVEANSHYDVNVTITPVPAKFGENTTIEVEVPEGMNNVTVQIDGKNITVPVDNTTGKGKLVIGNLTAGNHTISVITPGNENYTSKVNTTTLTVEKAVSDLTINISDVAPGEDVTVTVDVGPNATSYVVITVNGEEHVVPVDENGTATYVIPNAQPGDLNITAKYLGDDNYAPVEKSANTTVPKYSSELELLEPVITDDNNVTVVVKVSPEDATGTVTVTIDGKNYSADVKDGIANVNIGIVEPNTTPVMNITYSGDKKYNGTKLTSVDSIRVGKLNNLTTDITVVPGQYGENTTIIIDVPEDAEGNISVTVDNVSYPVKQDENGTYYVEVPSTVGSHNVTVKVENDTKYNDTEFKQSYTVDKNDKYDVNVTITPVPAKFGENTTIEVEVPEGMNNVTVQIDGKNITVPVDNTTGKGKLVIGNLTAGNHTISVITPGNENYTSKVNTTTLTVEKAVSDLTINISDVAPGEDVTVTVDVGPNATSYVVVTVNGEEHVVPVDENGTATYVIPNAQPGDLNITAKYLGDDNYAPVEKSANTTVPKFQPTVTVNNTVITDDNNVTVIVNVDPKDATGTVTVTVNGENYTAEVENGIAKVNIGILEPESTNNINITYSGDDKYNRTVITTADAIEVGKLNNLTADITVKPGQYGENTTIIIDVPEDAGGNISVTVDNVSYPVKKDENGTYYVEVPSTVGSHNVTVKVENDTKYNDTEFKQSFTVEPNDKYDINITVIPGAYGENTTVIVEVPEGFDDVTLTIDGEDYPIVYNETSGKFEAIIGNLTAGDHDITVTTPSTQNYTGKTNTTKISIPKAESDLSIDITGGEPGENITVTVNVGPNATGNVVVTVDGVEHLVKVNENGTATYVIPNAQPGSHNITAEFLGDDNYAPVKNNKTVDVPKFTPTVEVDNVEIADDNNVTVIVKVSPEDATGTVTVTVNGENYTADVKNGITSVNVGILEPNSSNNINITYSGDDKYNRTVITSSEPIEVGKLNNLTTDITVKPGQYGENTTIIIDVPEDADGNITVEVDNVSYPVKKDKNGTYYVEVPSTVGPHNVTVKIENDTNYNDTVFTQTFNVEPNDKYDINITVIPGAYGENTTVIVEVPDGFDDVTLTIDGEDYPIVYNETTGKFEAVIGNLTAGDHDITVTTPSTQNYTGKTNTTRISIPKAESDLSIDITGGEPGEDITVTVNVGPNATGKTLITVDGVEHLVDVDENGTATYVIPNAQPGSHNITAEFLGDDNYAPVTSNKTINVPKFTPTVEVDNVEIADDNNVTVIVKVSPEDATGTVTVTVNGENYTAEVENGIAKVNVGILPPNSSNSINITYSGDDKYNRTVITSAEPVEVGKLHNATVDVEIIPGEHGDNTTIKVTVPEDADGNITVIIDGKAYNATVENGTAIVNVTPTVGPHSIKVLFENDTNYDDMNYTSEFTVEPKDNYTLDIEITPGAYGENTTVTVTAPEGINEITVTIDGENHTVTIDPETGKGQLTVNNLTGGDHEIIAKFPGNENYTAKENRTVITIPKQNPEANITIEPVMVGEDPVINMTLQEDAGGYIIVDVNGTKYYFDVVNGTANITIPQLGNGTYNVTVTYSGDENYNGTVISQPLTVSKVSENITSTVNNVTLGENVIVKVTVPEDGEGTVTVTIGNITKTVPVTGGENEIIIPDVPVGDYDVTVTYNGNDKYEPATTVSELKVAPLPTSPDDVKVTDSGNGTIIITVPENATGNVTVTIDGENYTVPVVNGTATFNLTNMTNLTPGIHNVTVTYSGDENHTPVSYNTTVTIPKLSSQVKADTYTIREGDTEVITIEINREDAKGMVLIDIDGTGYYANVTNGKATLTVPNLKQGTHDVSVTYLGDNNYTQSTTTAAIKVEAPITIDIDGTGNNSNIVIDVPENTTGNVTVLIDGKEYTAVTDANGTVIIPLENITPGEHNVTVIYTDNNGVSSTVDSTINVPKWNTGIKAEAPTIREGDDATVTVSIDAKDATGTVLIDIDGVGYYANITNGKAIATIPNLKEGKYDVSVTYPGDDKYNNCTAKTTLTVEKGITVDLNTDGNDAKVVIELPENGTDDVTVAIDGKDYPVTVENNTATVDISDLAPGKHNVTVTYTDKQGAKSVVDDVIDVPKKEAEANVKYTPENDGGVIDVTLPKDATGPVLINVDGKKYYADAKDGLAKLTIDKLPVGTHNITVEYLGDDKYMPTSKITAVSVNKKTIGTILEVDPTLTRVANDYYKAGEEGDYFYGVLKDTEGNLLAGKTIQITVNGAFYNVTTDSQGRAGLKINLVSANVYTYALFFQGDDTYEAAKLASTRLTVTKKPTTLTASNAAFKASSKTKTIKVTLGTSKNPYDGKTYLSSKKVIKLTINGKTYTAKTNKNGVAKFTIKLTKKGTYTAKIKFKATKTYAGSSKKIKVTIK